MKPLITAILLAGGLIGTAGCSHERKAHRHEPEAEREAIPASARQPPSLSGDQPLLADSPYPSRSPETPTRPQPDIAGQPGTTGGRTTTSGYPGQVPPTAPAGGNTVRGVTSSAGR